MPPAAPFVAPTPRRRVSGGVLVAIVAVALVAAAGVAVPLVLLGSGSHATRTVVQILPAQPAAQTVRAVPAAQTVRAVPAAQPIGVAAIRSLLGDYTSAYSAEDVGGLARLFTADMQRKNGNDPVENRAQALHTYEQQFERLVQPNYELSNVRYRSDARSAVVSGRYSIVSANGASIGQIGFDLVRRNGRLMIDAIRTVPAQ